jgi:hypothetical protein
MWQAGIAALPDGRATAPDLPRVNLAGADQVGGSYSAATAGSGVQMTVVEAEEFNADERMVGETGVPTAKSHLLSR